MTSVLGGTGLEPVGMMKSSRLAVVIVSRIRGKSAMSRVSGKSVGMSAMRTALGSGVGAGGAFDILATNASGRLGASAKRDVSMRIGRSIPETRAVMISHLFGGFYRPDGTGSSKFLASPTPAHGAFDKLSG